MTLTTRGARRITWFFVSLIVLWAGVSPAGAVPVFSRKYGTSCVTCHTIFPKLNPFGEAFRLNGYRMPKELEEQLKQPQVSLGSESYKKIWPKAVAPSDLPGFAPFAMNVKMTTLYQSIVDASGRQTIKNDFQFPQEVNIFTAGTLGEHFGFFGEVTFGQNPDGSVETEIEHAQLHINSPFGREHLINFKIGKFAPDLEDGFQEMWLMTDNGVDSLFTFNPIGLNGGTGLSEEDAGISLPASVQGIELYGVAYHRLFYTVGVTNGLGPGAAGTVDGNNRKDVYARVDYKFGGMGLDGDTKGKALPSENWREQSFRVGILGYAGDGKGIDLPTVDPLVNQQDRRFQRAGLFASWYFKDLNVFGVALHGNDRLRNLDTTTTPEPNLGEATYTFDSWFAQADYVIRPPFQVSARYERTRPADATAPSIQAWNFNFSFLTRANVKMMAEYRFDPNDNQNYQIAGVLRFAY
jgi:hypothetical protein